MRVRRRHISINSRVLWAYLLLRASQCPFVVLLLHVCTLVELAVQIIDDVRIMRLDMATEVRDLTMPYFCAMNCHGYVALSLYSQIKETTSSSLQRFWDAPETFAKRYGSLSGRLCRSA